MVRRILFQTKKEWSVSKDGESEFVFSLRYPGDNTKVVIKFQLGRDLKEEKRVNSDKPINTVNWNPYSVTEAEQYKFYDRLPCGCKVQH